ncbi:MAG: glycosyl transferase family 2 [Desulfovibrionaceae bacterium]
MTTPDALLRASRAYTAAVLDFDMGESAPPATPMAADALQAAVERTVRLAAKRGACAVVLLGAGCGEFAAALAMRSPAPLLVSDLSPARVRTLPADGRPPHGHDAAVLADASPWAHLVIWALAGLSPDNALLALNPETGPRERAELQTLQRTFAGSRVLELDPAASGPADIALAAMLHPDEPDLAGFMAALPRSANRAALLWDAHAPPSPAPDCPLPAHHAAHPLGNDFAAQRNRMLEMAGAEWVFYLDADERVPPELDALLPALTRLPDVHGVHVPRLTLYPDAGRFKAGWGLWPDLQLRLFCKSPGVRFERPIHERVEGLPGKRAVLLDGHLLHLSRLLKRPEQIEAKLAGFDRAGAARHRLSQDYPTLPLRWLAGLTRPEAPRVLLA